MCEQATLSQFNAANIYLPTQDLLDHEIRHFLLCAGRWTVHWYNKPKFHILLHLTEHIRHFGPAILFATEAFESFNAIICAKSVHSNRHAPSRDIARAFAQGNRIRHLLSGGQFIFDPLTCNTSAKPAPATEQDSEGHPPFSFKEDSWKGLGEGPRGLVHGTNTVTAYLGLNGSTPLKEGTHPLCYYPSIC